MAFNGKLIQLKTGANYVDFPLKYIKAESYKVTPDQRMESKAARAATGLLVRTTCDHTASKIDFDTTPLTNADVNDIQTKLTAAYTDDKQRKLTIKYYNPADDAYHDADVYVPDIDYNITRVDVPNKVIYYDSVRYAFIEY